MSIMLERLKELEAKATPAPWVSRVGQAGICNKYLDESIIDGEERDGMKPENVRLIIEMRNVLPKLLAFVTAWDDCQTVTANRAEKMRALYSAREALDAPEQSRI
jgi:hypothetical protein